MPSSIKEIVASNITRLRQRAGLTQRLVAEELKTTAKTVHLWEKAVTWPESDKFDHMASLFNVPVTEFFAPLDKSDEYLPPTDEYIVAAVAERFGFDASALKKKKKADLDD